MNGDLDGIQVSISAEMNAYTQAMAQMARTAEATARRVERAFASVSANIERQGAPGIEPLKQLDVALETTATNAERAGRRMEGAFGGFGFGSGLQGIAIQMAGFAAIMGTVAIAARGLQTMGDFERDIAMLGAVSESSAAQIAPLREQAIQLGAETSRSATDVARLQVELGKLGWSLDRVKTSTPGILNLSIAGDMDAGEAAKLVGSTIQQFKLQASAAQEVADTLAQAAIKSAADVRDFATSLDYVGGIAAQYGMTLKDTTAALMALSDAGFNPSMAATGLRSLIFDFTTPTMHAREFFKTIKFETRDAAGQVKPLVQLIDEFNAALSKRGMNINTIPYGIIDTNSSAALAALMQQGTEKIRQNQLALDDAKGAADRLAKVYTTGLQGAIERLGGAWDSLAIAFGDSGFLQNATRLVDGLATALAGLADITTQLSADGGFFGKGGLYDAATTYLYDAMKGQIGTAGTIKEREAAYSQYQSTQAQRAADQSSREALQRQDAAKAYGAWVYGQAGMPQGPGPAPAPTPRPPQMPNPMLDQMRQEVRDLETLAKAAGQGAEAYRKAQESIARANVVREGGSGALYDRQIAAQKELNTQLERMAALQAEITAASLAEFDARFRFNDEAQAALNAEIDAYFQIEDAKAAIMTDTARTIEDERAIAAAARQGADAYERMVIARRLMAENGNMMQEEADRLAAGLQGAQKATELAINEMRRLEGAAEQVGDTFASAMERAIFEGGKLKDVVGGLLRDIARITLRASVTEPAGNALGNFLKGIFGGGGGFGGGRAIGGAVAAGVPYLVGEKGPELFVPRGAGEIIANHKLSAGGGGVTQVYAPNIDARGADAAAVARLELALAQDRAVRAQETRAIFRDGRNRRMIR